MTSAEAGSSHTNWALIGEAGAGGAQAHRAIEQLVRRYWPAVYAFSRHFGHSVDEAADVTQSFICDVVLARNLFQTADPKRGRFRTLLLTSLQNFIRDQYRRGSAMRRTSDPQPMHFDKSELESVSNASGLTPEQAFSMQWHATMLRRVLERVRIGCAAAGLDAHWRVFEARIVRPMLFGDEPVSYSKLVELLELDDSGQAANMMVTVRRRLVRALIEEVGCTVSDPMQVEDEIRALLHEVEATS